MVAPMEITLEEGSKVRELAQFTFSGKACTQDPAVVPLETLDMVIKSDFAKYMIDQRASLVERAAGRSVPGCVLAPAQPAQLRGGPGRITVNRATARAGSRPLTSLSLLVGGQQFTILLEPSLRRFLPHDLTKHPVLYSATAATKLDSFLFLQFPGLGLQVRTLLLERDSDLARVFTEQSFFALSRETEVGWAERLGFTLEPGPGRARLHPPPQGRCGNLRVGLRNTELGLRYEKGDYQQARLEVEQAGEDSGVFLLFHHTSDLQANTFLASARTAVLSCVSTGNSGFRLSCPGVQDRTVKVVTSQEELPATLLTCQTFLLPASLQLVLEQQQLLIITSHTGTAQPEPELISLTETQEGFPLPDIIPLPSPAAKPEVIPLKRFVGPPSQSRPTSPKIPSPATSPGPGTTCPFPRCGAGVEGSVTGLLTHLLSCHTDFARVIAAQLSRHSSKSRRTGCPFLNCPTANQDLNRHYADAHGVGLIVFLQFAMANKWDITAWRAAGVVTSAVESLVQCSHCYEVMSRPQLTIHVAEIRKQSTSTKTLT